MPAACLKPGSGMQSNREASIPTHHFTSHFLQTENLCSGFGSLTQDHVSEITDFNGNIKLIHKTTSENRSETSKLDCK